jgi:hypothetical protein
MDAGVVAALITAGISLLVALLGAGLTIRENNKTRKAQQSINKAQISANIELERVRSDHERLVEAEKRRAEAAAQLDLSREPLLSAARDLRDRMGNIRKNSFLYYARGSALSHRQEMAKRGTAFRLARYWAVLEDLYGTTDLLAFERNEDTRPVTNLVKEIGQTFAKDSHGMGGQRLMMWREEQRAIGELMITTNITGDAHRYINYATFVQRYDELFAPWFSGFLEDLAEDNSEQSPRLERIHRLLIELVAALEEGRA